MNSKPIPSVASHILVLAALLAILCVSALQAVLHTGTLGRYLSIAAAVVQALLVLITFMRLKYESGILRLIAVLSFAWPFILVILTFGDYLTRVVVQAW